MGAKQSKRSVDISGTPKKGELENGTVTATQEKLEKIGEGDVATSKVNANGSTTTTSTVTAEQQETAAADVTATSPAEAGDAPCTKTEAPVEQAEKPADVSTASVAAEDKEEPSSPASPNDTTTEESGSEKKKKSKKKWSFRSFSFSKKDKVKPAAKEEKQETVPEGNENTQTEQVNSEAPANVSAVPCEEPPPLPTSPPPTPADETAEKEETPTISEGDVDASGGGEGLAEPIEEIEESTTTATTPAPAAVEATSTPAAPVAAVEPPLTNGVAEQNGDHKEQNGKFNEDDELISPVHERKPSVDSVTAKIGSLKLQIASENAAEQPAQNGVSDETAPIELNGTKESDVPTTENAAVEN